MKTLRFFLTSIFMLCCSAIYAYSFKVDDIYYDITSTTDKTVAVTYQNTNYYSYSGDIVIPETIEYNGTIYSVTMISDNAFRSCSSLTSIELPAGITSIGHCAFFYCSNLTSIELPAGLTSIGQSAFSYCSNLTSIELPAGITSIGSYAFQSCSSLTNIELPAGITSIGTSAFKDCTSLTSLNLPIGITSIGNYAFMGCTSLSGEIIVPGVNFGDSFRDCSSLTGIVLSEGTTSISKQAFNGCSSLKSITLPTTIKTIAADNLSKPWPDCLDNVYIADISAWCNISFSDNPTYSYANPLNSGSSEKNLYLNGELVTEIVIPNDVTEIKHGAFYGYTKLEKVTIGESVQSIGKYAFNNTNAVFKILAETPPTLVETPFMTDAVFLVPSDMVDDYKEAWTSFSAKIGDIAHYKKNVNVVAKDNSSGILEAIGLENISSVVDLTVQGSINSYDIIQFRDKMPLLRNLDISETNVVASIKAFYNGNCTNDNHLGNETFIGLTKLHSIRLPKTLKGVGDYCFSQCTHLRSIELPSTVQSIGKYAFRNCSNLGTVEMSNNVQAIGVGSFSGCSSLKTMQLSQGVKILPDPGTYTSDGVFAGCTNLERVILPDSLTTIPKGAFYKCNKLNDIKFPTTVNFIGQQAFYQCYSLTEIKIPSSVKSIGSSAFSGCDNLQKVYTYTVVPTVITESTFSTFETATLYAPQVSYWNYYWDEGWKRFLNFEKFDEPYEYFYLDSDKVLDDDSGFIEGDGENHPDADINVGGGIDVGGEENEDDGPKQPLGDVNVENDGNGNSGSMIGNSNLVVDNLNIKINVKGGKWYFFAFPFDIKMDKISMQNGSRYVWRYYDGDERANGKSGWKDVNGNKLNAAQGYIFQCSANDVLILNIEDVHFKKEDKYNELVAHMSDNLKDASWNFMGNPYLSYYDMGDMEYSAPVTVWDGSKYVAIRPGDDDYHFTPFEAFFVQKPEGTNEVGFDGEQQMTQTQSKEKKAKQAAARKMMVMNARAKENPRKLVNLTLTAGEESDGTRIVFNEAQSRAYETACDAAKFETQGVIQLFTIGDQKERYAINERPADNGIVMLGFTAPTAGEFSISATRMDTPVYLKDLETGALVDLSKDSYKFTAKAGTYTNRFEVLTEATVTGINQVGTTEGEDAKVYDLGGRRVKENGKGVYIINGEKTLVK